LPSVADTIPSYWTDCELRFKQTTVPPALESVIVAGLITLSVPAAVTLNADDPQLASVSMNEMIAPSVTAGIVPVKVPPVVLIL
jgi:hypothetical protein